MSEANKKRVPISATGKEIKVGNLYYLKYSETFRFRQLGEITINNYDVMMAIEVNSRTIQLTTASPAPRDVEEVYIRVFFPHIGRRADLFEKFVRENLIEA